MCSSFVGYVISFVSIAIYWNHHHHLLHVVKKVDGWIMWANMYLLFWLSLLSLLPVLPGWLGDHPASTVPTLGYGAVLFMAGIAWLLLQRAIIHAHGRNSELDRALGSDWKGNLSGVSYLAAIGIAFVAPWVSIAIYVLIAIVWVVPDRRIAKEVGAHDH